MEKIKKSLRKEDGFTLVELLAVIVILGIILAIAIPAIGNVIKNSRIDGAQAEYDMVTDAARLYFMAEEKDRETGVEISTLITDDYLEARGSDGFVYVDGGDTVKYDSTTSSYIIDDLLRPSRVSGEPGVPFAVANGKVTRQSP